MASKGSEDVLNAVQVLVQHLCTKCPERAEYRSIVAKVRSEKWRYHTSWVILNFFRVLSCQRIARRVGFKVRETCISKVRQFCRSWRKFSLSDCLSHCPFVCPSVCWSVEASVWGRFTSQSISPFVKEASHFLFAFSQWWPQRLC